MSNLVDVTVSPRLSGHERVNYIRRVWTEMLLEEQLDPKYFILVPFGDAVLDIEYEAHHNSFFLPSRMQDPPSECFTSDGERAFSNNEEDEPLNLPCPPAQTLTQEPLPAASLSPKKGGAW